MRIAVFGATGPTGKLIVERALAAGNDVVAFARDPARLGRIHERLTIVRGELADAAAVERAVGGAEAVISVLGPRPRENLAERPLSRGMETIIGAMARAGTRRLVVSSTPSAADPNDLPDLRFRILVGIIKSLMRPAYDEIVNVARIVRGSDTDWTIVRVTLLNSGPGSGRIRTGYLGRRQIGTRISRADLAAFMLDQASDRTWLRKAPAVSD